MSNEDTESNPEIPSSLHSRPSNQSSTPDVLNIDSQQDTDETSGTKTTPIEDIDAGWTEFFPYDEPYTDQVDGISTFLDALTTYDNMVMEGACGTGKTLIALTAGCHIIRNQEALTETYDSVPDYSRVLAVTPVKQQLKQFIEEMNTINAQLDSQSNMKSVVMRGQNDMLPYAYTEQPPFDEHSVTEKIDDLRKLTIEVIKFGSDIPLDWPDGMSPKEYSKHDYNWNNPSEEAAEMAEEYKYDPDRAEAVTKILEQSVSVGEAKFSVNGYESPYPERIPETTDVANTRELGGTLPTELQGKFDPFFAGFHAYDSLPFWFHDATNSVMDMDSLIRHGIENGVCPHKSMGEMMQFADVLIGNYYHVFDPDTRLLTDMKADILDSETICVVDEAHNIEEEVRDILSKDFGIHTIRTAKQDIQTAIGYMTSDMGELPRSEQQEVSKKNFNEAHDNVKNIMTNEVFDGLGVDDFREVIEVLQTLLNYIKRESRNYLDTRFDNGWEWVVNEHPNWVETEEIPLEEPKETGEDDVTTMIEETYDEEIWSTVYSVGAAAKLLIDELSICERLGVCGGVTTMFYRWKNESHTEYFREIVLEENSREKPLDDSEPWTTEWTPKYQLYNCIPTQQLRQIFSELGSALLMSATLEPIDVLIETTGINQCISPDEVAEKEQRAGLIASGDADEMEELSFRDVVTRQYPLRFPKENRVSIAVDAPKYTKSNRGGQTVDVDTMSETRRTYMNVLLDVVQTPGNVLVSMPSYGEAQWAKKVLKTRGVNNRKEIILDQSSSSTETDETLDEFFNGSESVLITSTRGTVTEGVDYDGEKLHTVAVLGISLLPPTNRNKAIEFAYDERLSDSIEGVSGFEMTNKIPATRKARQAVGRVIRGDDERGVRLLVDKRYTYSDWGGVKEYLSGQEQEEFRSTSPESVSQKMQLFWG